MDTTLLKVVRIALEIISDRLLTILMLIMSFALAWYTIVQPDLIRFGTMAFFSTFGYFVVTIKEKRSVTQDTGD